MWHDHSKAHEVRSGAGQFNEILKPMFGRDSLSKPGALFRISILMINQVFAKSNVQNRLW